MQTEKVNKEICIEALDEIKTMQNCDSFFKALGPPWAGSLCLVY